MRIRFWATIRKPAFSISALTAPVRLRSVASGLMIEKVRSVAMLSSLQTLVNELRGLYRRDPATASDPVSPSPLVLGTIQRPRSASASPGRHGVNQLGLRQ